jgi:hypothetical protein
VFSSISYKSKQFLWLVFKLAVVIACCYFIYEKIAHNKNIEFDSFWSFLIDFNLFSLKNILFLSIFTLFNWVSEITKWQFLVKKIQPISWSTACIQTLASSTLAMITPIRTGEYGVKVLYYSKSLRKDIALAAFIGNSYQLLISLGLGVFGILYLFKYFEKGFISIVFVIFLLGLLTLFLLFAFRNTFSFLRTWFPKFLTGFRFMNHTENRNAFLLSLIRYLIFSHQFYFLITLFGIDISYIDAMASITAMYGLTSVVPILPLFDFLLKGSVSILVFSFFNVDPILIITIASIMWILNFAIPALIGSVFMLKLKPVAI